MLTTYPPIHPYKTQFVTVSNIHTLYLEESGNPEGLPVLFLHGGPGVGCHEGHRRFFDPNRYRIILFDQRGAGQSTPHAELKENHTEALISDIESIRQLLNIEKLILFGGSWGSTLALLYAARYPTRVQFLIVRGIFLGRSQDLAWLYQNGVNRIFPDQWQTFCHYIPELERENLIASYYKRLTGQDEVGRLSAAKHWCQWEGSLSTLDPNTALIHQLLEPHTALGFACIGAHYMYNQVFLKPNQILADIHLIADIPGIIIHGRYDMVCPLEQAYALHKVWPASELHVIRNSGHSASEPGTVNALIQATNTVADKYY